MAKRLKNIQISKSQVRRWKKLENFYHINVHGGVQRWRPFQLQKIAILNYSVPKTKEFL